MSDDPPLNDFAFEVEPLNNILIRAAVSTGLLKRSMQFGNHAYLSALPMPHHNKRCYFFYGLREHFFGLWAGGSRSVEEIGYAALRTPQEVVFAPHRPWRHGDIFFILEAYGFTERERYECEEGFLTSWGRFVDRIEGLEIALSAQQIKLNAEGKKPTAPSYELFSEDIW